MPRVTKDTNLEEFNKKPTKSKSTKISTQKTATTEKKVASKKSTTKKGTLTKTTFSKKDNTPKVSSTKQKKNSTSNSKKVESNIVAEYYDLPYRYNETMVKILYQTPTVLFVYWDISDHDRQNFMNNYGDNFFNTTSPVLKIYNLTKNYDFEVPINDFANSWYIQVNDAGCDYKVELFRKPTQNTNNNAYIFVSSSNDIEFPNDHILLEKLPNSIQFKNVKNNDRHSKDISTLHLVGVKNIHSVYDFYKKLYKDEILEEISNKKIINPSSSSWS